MPTAVTNQIPKVQAIINQPQKPKEANDQKVSTWNGHKITTVAILVISSAVAAVAAIVASIFSLYLVAVVCAVAAVALVLAAIVASGIDIPQEIHKRIEELAKKNKALTSEIQGLKGQTQPDAAVKSDINVNELEKKIEELNKIVKDHELVEQQLREELNSKQKKIEELQPTQDAQKKPVDVKEQNPAANDQLQQTSSEIEILKKDLETTNDQKRKSIKILEELKTQPPSQENTEKEIEVQKALEADSTKAQAIEAELKKKEEELNQQKTSPVQQETKTTPDQTEINNSTPKQKPVEIAEQPNQAKIEILQRDIKEQEKKIEEKQKKFLQDELEEYKSTLTEFLESLKLNKKNTNKLQNIINGLVAAKDKETKQQIAEVEKKLRESVAKKTPLTSEQELKEELNTLALQLFDKSKDSLDNVKAMPKLALEDLQKKWDILPKKDGLLKYKDKLVQKLAEFEPQKS